MLRRVRLVAVTAVFVALSGAATASAAECVEVMQVKHCTPG